MTDFGKTSFTRWTGPATRALLPWTVAALTAALLGSIVNTGFNMAALQRMGASVPPLAWLGATLHDLYSFMPFYMLIVACATGVAFPVAELVALRLRRRRETLLVAAGAAGLVAAFATANHVSPMPTVVAATRTPAGYVAMLCTGMVAGIVFAVLNRRSSTLRRVGQRGILSVVVSGGVFGLLGIMHFSARADSVLPPDGRELQPYDVETIVDGLGYPWGLAILPDGRLLVTERPGLLRLVSADGELDPAPVRGVPEVLPGGQGGLMDITLAPDFPTSGRVYLTYACGRLGRNNTCLSRARFTGQALTEEQKIFASVPFTDTTKQYGSRVEFLGDGTLLMTLGDKFDFRELAQDLGTDLGKIVRLSEDGGAARDNPFVHVTGARHEIYSYGHRNPQGLALDPVSGAVYVSEHGPRGGDEINLVEAGVNYGWPTTTHGVNYPGDLVSPYTERQGVRGPVHQWTPSIAPSGIAVYRGELFPELDGDLLVASLAGRAVYWLDLEDGRVVDESRLFSELGKRIRNVTVAPDGSIYLLTDHESGEILRVTPRWQPAHAR